MAAERMRRVEVALRAVLSEAITKELKDPRVGFITVTGVQASADLRFATVYVSVLGDEAARSQTLAALRRAHGFLQGCVARELRLKRTPTLRFANDESVQRGMRITELLAEPPALARQIDEADGEH